VALALQERASLMPWYFLGPIGFLFVVAWWLQRKVRLDTMTRLDAMREIVNS
jgi:hypothetical protein